MPTLIARVASRALSWSQLATSHASAFVPAKMVDAFKRSVNEAGGFDSVDAFKAKWAAARS